MCVFFTPFLPWCYVFLGGMFCVTATLEDPFMTHAWCSGWGKEFLIQGFTVHDPSVWWKSHTLSRKTAPKHLCAWLWGLRMVILYFFYCSSSCLLTKLLIEDLLPPFKPVWIEQVYNFISDVLWQLLGLAHGGREVRKEEIASVCFNEMKSGAMLIVSYVPHGQPASLCEPKFLLSCRESNTAFT